MSLFRFPMSRITLQLLIALIVLWFMSFFMFVTSFARVLFNITTNECINFHKYSYINLLNPYINPNDRGFYNNLYYFFTCDDTPVPTATIPRRGLPKIPTFVQSVERPWLNSILYSQDELNEKNNGIKEKEYKMISELPV